MSLSDLPIKVALKGDLKDITGPLLKLLETLAAPFRCWAETRKPVHEAKAQVDALMLKIKAMKDLEENYHMPQNEAAGLVFRAEQLQLCQNIQQQLNFEAIVEGTIPLLPASVSEQPVDPDWTADFFDQSKNVSNEQMRSLWSKILAGEVSTPGSFSKRVLSFVRELSTDEAQWFTKACSYVWHGGDDTFFIILGPEGKPFADLDFDILLELEAIGLMKSTATVQAQCQEISYFDEKFQFQSSNGRPASLRTQVIPLTALGRCLEPISGAIKIDSHKIEILSQIEKHYHLMPQPKPHGVVP